MLGLGFQFLGIMRTRRMKIGGAVAVYHCMTRTVNGEMLFKDREKEMLRKMLWQVADFSGVEILTYCIMSNHFRVPEPEKLSDKELLRRYKVLYPTPTKYQTASVKVTSFGSYLGESSENNVRISLAPFLNLEPVLDIAAT